MFITGWQMCPVDLYTGPDRSPWEVLDGVQWWLVGREGLMVYVLLVLRVSLPHSGNHVARLCTGERSLWQPKTCRSDLLLTAAAIII